MYVRRETTELSAADCRSLKQACINARDIGYPLNTHVTFAPYPGSLPSPAARSSDLNRVLSHVRSWVQRKLSARLVALWVWHSDVTGRNPHAHIFMHCPSRHRDELSRALVPCYPSGVMDVREGSDIRKLHYSGFSGSTLDYLMRFKSQQAWWADGGRTYRASIRDESGRRRGIKSPIIGKRWGCTRNISPRKLHFAAKAKARAAALDATRRAA